MAVTQRGRLSPEDQQRLAEAMDKSAQADRLKAEFREVVIEMVKKSSYREVERSTGVSTNTLQRWKRDAEA